MGTQDGSVSHRLAQIAVDRVRVASLFVAVGLPTAVVLSEPAGVGLPPSVYLVNAIAVAGVLLLYGFVVRGRLPLRLAHLGLAAVCTAAPLVSTFTELVTGQVSLVAPLMVAILSMSLQLDVRWALASFVLVLGFWIPTHLHTAPPGQVTITSLSVAGTAVISFAYQLIARRYIVAAERSRQLAETTADQLRAELDERQRAESERERLREQFNQAQRMEAVGTLAAGLAHDMNNILAGIRSVSEALLDESTDSPHRAELESICREASRGAALTHGLLAFSHRGQYRTEILTLDTVVDQILPLLQRTLPKTIAIVRTGQSAATIEGDQSQLGQILMNLCLHAADAMPHGGTLTVTTGVESSTHGTITVSDTGEGMDAQTRDRIFEPFFTTKSVGTGPGLGLAMAYGAVQNHGGTIEVESKLGSGTTFRIRLPITAAVPTVRPTVTAAAPRSDGDQSRRRGLVLLVDDEPLVRRGVTRLLERLGLTVLTATNGAEGVELMRERGSEVSLVILDMSMPVMGGAECYRRIRELSAVPVLLASGYAVEAEARAVLASGAAGFLDKPFTAAILAEHIDRVLGPLIPAVRSVR